jgi:putative sigma-54 modulation protein
LVFANPRAAGGTPAAVSFHPETKKTNRRHTMQTANVNVPIRVTGRHVSITEAIRDYANSKVEHIHLDYPRIIEAHVILDVTKHRHAAEIVLHCANHITIEADHVCDDMYAAIDGVIGKITQQMRKYKTKMLRNHRPRRGEHREFDEHILRIDEHFELHEESEPKHLHTERYMVKTLFVDEALLQLELAANRPFVVFQNSKTERVNILHRRRDGSFGLIELNMPH